MEPPPTHGFFHQFANKWLTRHFIYKCTPSTIKTKQELPDYGYHNVQTFIKTCLPNTWRGAQGFRSAFSSSNTDNLQLIISWKHEDIPMYCRKYISFGKISLSPGVYKLYVSTLSTRSKYSPTCIKWPHKRRSQRACTEVRDYSSKTLLRISCVIFTFCTTTVLQTCK